MKRFVLAVVVIAGYAALAADKIQPLNVKLGLWETTSTTQMSGMPPIPPEALAHLTPEQRAKIEASMGAEGQPKTHTTKSCMTKEKMEKAMFGEERQNCKRTVVTSTGSKAEVRLDCDQQGMKTSGTVRVDAVDSENVKGSVKAESTGGGNTMKVNSNFTSKWLSADCGKVE